MDETSVGDEWNSGEALTVTLIDQDLNKNTLVDEDLLIMNTTRTHLIPSLQIGSPITIIQNLTLDSASADVNDHRGIGYIESVSNYSKIGYWTNSTVLAITGNTVNFTVMPGWTGTDIQDLGSADNIYFNWDFSAFTNSSNTMVGVCLFENLADDECHAGGDTNTGIDKITGVSTLSGAEMYIDVKTLQNNGDPTEAAAKKYPVIADVFSYGTNENNAIYRILLEETDNDTGIFEGSIEYMMLNQVNIDLESTYTDLATVDQDIDIIVEQDMTDEDSPRVNYFDKGADGVNTQIADQVEAPTHEGVV
jgi:hypothetical protein